MFSKIATEALVQRGRSTLFLNLTTILQDSHDILKNEPSLTNEVVLKAFKKINLAKRLWNAFLDNNMLIHGVGIRVNDNPLMECVADPNPSFTKGSKGKNKTPGMIMEEIHRLYDDRTGKIGHNEDIINPQEVVYRFGIILFTGLWRLRNKDGSFYITPSEIAAGILHEAGHIDHFVRTLHRTQERILDASDIIDYVKSEHNSDVVKELIKSLKKSPYLDKSWNPVIKTVETYFNTSNSLDDPYYWEALNAMMSAMAAEVSSNTLKDFYTLTRDNSPKHPSDLSLVDAERSADEFSSRHGSYQDLLSFLVKLDKLDKLSEKEFPDFYQQTQGQTVPYLINVWQQFKHNFGVKPEEISDGYDPLVRRMSLIIETAKHAFHDDRLSKDTMKDLKQQIAKSEAYLKEYSNSDARKTRLMIKGWKDNISKFGRIVKSPIHNRLYEDYTRLQDANRSLSRHPLYYLAKT